MLKSIGFCVLFFLLSYSKLNACGGTGLPSYGGEILYSTDSTNPMKVNLKVSMFFANNENLSADFIQLAWSDSGSFNNGLDTIYATSIDTDSLAFANATITPYIFRHIYEGSITFTNLPASGFYYVYLVNTYRPAGVVNIDYNDSYLVPYTIQTKMRIDTSSNFLYTPPVMLPVDIFVCGTNSFYNNQLISLVKGGDSVGFSITSPLFNFNTPVPEYETPSQTCGGIADTSFTINGATGVISWPVVCHDSIYDITELISTYRNGKLIGAVMRDQLLYTLEGTTAITETKTSLQLDVYPNPANTVLNIQLPDNAINGTLTLYDLTGREVLTGRATEDPLQTIDISALPSGAYLLSFKCQGGLFTQKIIKQ